MKRIKIQYLLAALIAVGLLAPAIVWASGSLNVSSSTGLSNGQVVSVSGSGFSANSTGSILECNNDPNQPTIEFVGNPVSVSCSNPFSELVTTNGGGNLPSTSFTIVSGTVGPPTTGTDSSGGNATTDAAAYPCPPTQAQVNAGYACNLSFGDQANDEASQNLTFTTAYSGSGSSSSGGSSSGGSGSTGGSSSGSSGSTNKSSSSSATKSATPTTATTATPATTPTTQSTTKTQTSPKLTIVATTKLTITVNNSKGQPVSGAKVILDNKTSVITGKNGLGTFQSVSLGSHDVSVSDPGKKPTKLELTLSSGQDRSVSIKLANNKSSTTYLIIAVVVALLLAGTYLYWVWSHRSPKASNPLAAAPAPDNTSVYIATEPTVSPAIEQSPSPTPQVTSPAPQISPPVQPAPPVQQLPLPTPQIKPPTPQTPPVQQIQQQIVVPDQRNTL
ncbi:MAG: carboxypeptidase regulatory-like domain-containing protein [Candidatus Saccharibacteria bacterium]